jgi:hypothetical protein
MIVLRIASRRFVAHTLETQGLVPPSSPALSGSIWTRSVFRGDQRNRVREIYVDSSTQRRGSVCTARRRSDEMSIPQAELHSYTMSWSRSAIGRRSMAPTGSKSEQRILLAVTGKSWRCLMTVGCCRLPVHRLKGIRLTRDLGTPFPTSGERTGHPPSQALAGCLRSAGRSARDQCIAPSHPAPG